MDPTEQCHWYGVRHFARYRHLSARLSSVRDVTCRMATRIETARLVIRTFEPGDGERWVALVSEAEVRRFLPPGAEPTLETFETVIRTRNAMEREIGYSMWAVDDKATRTFVGQCGIRPVDEGAGPRSTSPTTSSRPRGTRATPLKLRSLCSGMVWAHSASNASWPSSCLKTSARGEWKRRVCDMSDSSITTGWRA